MIVALVIVIVLVIWGVLELVGIYGIVVVVMVQFLFCGLIVVLDVFGLIIDNVGGIVEMVNMFEEVCNVIDLFDVVGNIMKVVIKGYAIGLVVLVVLVLFVVFKIEFEEKGGVVVEFVFDDLHVFMGLLIGGMMVCLFVVLLMEVVGRVGVVVVEEVCC